MNELLDLFEKGFPTESCTIQDTRQPEILNSNIPYWCLTVDERFKDVFSVLQLYPYIAQYDDGSDFYGWVDKSGNLYDDCQHPNGNYDTVIMYKK
jgi:hypothetical protein